MHSRFFRFRQHVVLTVIVVGVSLPWCVRGVDVSKQRGGIDAHSVQAAGVDVANAQQVKKMAIELQGLGCTDQEILTEFKAALANQKVLSEAEAAAASRTLDLVLISLGLIGLDYWNEYGGDDEDWDEPGATGMTAVPTD
jgi:hypothetical protein